MSEAHFVSFCEGCIRGMHQQVLQRLLNICCSSALGIADETRERRVLQHRLLYIVLKVFNVLGRSFRQHTYVFLECSTVLFEEAFGAAQDLCISLCLAVLSVCLARVL